MAVRMRKRPSARAEAVARALREELARAADLQQARLQLDHCWAGPPPQRAGRRRSPPAPPSPHALPSPLRRFQSCVHRSPSPAPAPTPTPPYPQASSTKPLLTPTPKHAHTPAFASRERTGSDYDVEEDAGTSTRRQKTPREHRKDRLPVVSMQDVLQIMTAAQARRRFAPAWAFVAWELDRAWFGCVLDFFFEFQGWPRASQLPRALLLACQAASLSLKELYVQEPFAPVYVRALRDIDRDWFDWAVDFFFGTGHWPPFGQLPKTLQEACLDVGVACSVEGASPHASRHGPRLRDAPPLAELFEDATLGRKVPSGKDVQQLERLLERLKAIRGTNSHKLDSKTD